MGLYFRKSVRMGLFRVNFSSSGIGLSAGIPGLRIGTGPRGNYIQMGAHGIYYRAALPSSRRYTASPRSVTPAPPARSFRPESSPPIPSGTVGESQPIESVDAAELVDSSSEDLLNEIRKKHKQVRSWPFVATASLVGLGFAAVNNLLWVLVAIAVLGLLAIIFAYRWDVMRKLVVLHYDIKDQPQSQFTALVDSATQAASAARTWHISASANVRDRKYHAGASSTVDRKGAKFSNAQPPYIASNLDPVTLTLSKATFYFFPDRLVVFSNGHVGAVTYANLHAKPMISKFIEEEGVPRDSKVVARTWKYVNKSGGPDKRFKNNRELPICAYGEISLKSEFGINELLMISQLGPEVRLAEAINRLGSQPESLSHKSSAAST
jgi:hypothetical protein